MDKIAIIDNDIDILRIIPLCSGKYPDFKFSLLGNDFFVKSWELGQKSPQIIESNAEITYHSSKKGKKPIVHIKDESAVYLYKTVFSKIIDIKLDTCFPLPLCKVEIKEVNKRIYKKEKDHKIFDFRYNVYTEESLSSFGFSESDFPKFNVVEIYITSKEYNENFLNTWPNYDALWQCTTIDYLINGPELSQGFLNKFKAWPQLSHCCDTSFDQFNVLYRPYYDENVKENSITFYENYDYITILATTPIKLIDMNTKEDLSKIAPAFAFDLTWQLDHGISRKETDQMNRIFKKMINRVNDLHIHRHIFCMPQI